MHGRGAGLLLSILVAPEQLLRLGVDEQTLVLRQARSAGLLGWLACRLERLGLDGRCPPKLRAHLVGARIFAAEHERMLRWELHHIERALTGLEVELVLLKGAAYVFSGLPIACGRLVSDVDILAPKRQLRLVEEALSSHGWEPMKLDEYDQAYYRAWMHELPPLRHRHRHTVVDVHHNILPETSRLCPDPELLLAAAVRLEGGPLKILCPTDTVLHKLVHLFHDGAFENALRELVDVDGLLRAYGADDGFWGALTPRARRLGLLRPLFYGLRYSTRLLQSPVPRPVSQAARAGRPWWPVRWLMDLLVVSVLTPGDPDRSYPGKALAGWLLYLRSHWLRMPPLLLARHLLTKTGKRLANRSEAQ